MDVFEKVKQVEASGSHCLEFYNNWADTFDKDLAPLEYNAHNVLAAEMSALYPLETRHDIEIIDMCAGTGLVGEQLQASGFTTIDALDACEPMLMKAEQKQIYRRLFCDRLGPNRLNIDDDRYDALTGSGMFIESHVNENCFLELIRIVKRGGYLVLIMRETYLTEQREYFKDFEPTIKRYEAAGLWKMMARKTFPDYVPSVPGIVYILQIV